jgi:hypothetical protein
MDFMNSVGVLLPMELWGRCVLYSCLNEDLGCSAAGGTLRAGFERIVAEVCLGKVGAVAAREVSRFARNSRDWQQLVEMCRVVDTLLIDQEAVYAPRQGNDRLLLGLKGSLNEYELDLLRHRSLAARYEKARRGELVVAAPVGFIKVGDRLEKDPDRRVHAAIHGSWSTSSTCRPGSTPVRWSGAEDIQEIVLTTNLGAWQGTCWKSNWDNCLYSDRFEPREAGIHIL